MFSRKLLNVFEKQLIVFRKTINSFSTEVAPIFFEVLHVYFSAGDIAAKMARAESMNWGENEECRSKEIWRIGKKSGQGLEPKAKWQGMKASAWENETYMSKSEKGKACVALP